MGRIGNLDSVAKSPQFSYLADSYILDHYWLSDTVGDVFKGTFKTFHNETLNTWTHILGGIYFILQAACTSSPCTFVYRIFAACCFTFSGLSHMFHGSGQRLSRVFGILDYVGIGSLILASTLSLCMALSKDESNVLFQIKLALSLGIPSFIAAISFSEYKFLRTLSFVIAACSSLVPLIFAEHDAQLRFYLSETLPKIIACHACGLFFYLTRYPEKGFPGAFDLLLQSHHIWHICVWLASYFHDCGLDAIVEQNAVEI